MSVSESPYIFPRTTVVSTHGSAAFPPSDSPVYIERHPGYGRAILYPLTFQPPAQAAIFPPPPPPGEKGKVIFALPSPPSGSLLKYLIADYKVLGISVTKIELYLGNKLVYTKVPDDKIPLDGPIQLPLPQPGINAVYTYEAIQVVFYFKLGPNIPGDPHIDFYSVGVVAEEFYKPAK